MSGAYLCAVEGEQLRQVWTRVHIVDCLYTCSTPSCLWSMALSRAGTPECLRGQEWETHHKTNGLWNQWEQKDVGLCGRDYTDSATTKGDGGFPTLMTMWKIQEQQLRYNLRVQIQFCHWLVRLYFICYIFTRHSNDFKEAVATKVDCVLVKNLHLNAPQRLQLMAN